MKPPLLSVESAPGRAMVRASNINEMLETPPITVPVCIYLASTDEGSVNSSSVHW